MGLNRVAAPALAALLLLTSCGHEDGALSGEVTRGGVSVRAELTGNRLAVTFAPQRRGFHVYSVDLPEGGVQGLGVATKVQLSDGLVSTGEARADRPVRQLSYPSLHLTLPVYPDGPVTVRQAVRRTDGRPRLQVTYAACSESLCLAPVRALEVPLGD